MAPPAATSWGSCPETVTSPGAVCTTVAVPQDYSQPAGETIDVTVSKLPAHDPGARRGALFGNAGGVHRAGCEAASGDDWRHLTTENTARDWEQVRQALGEERISIHGLSYGTLLGSTYATLFPQHTDKMVLDSGANPDWMWNEVLSRQNDPYKQRVHAMFEWIDGMGVPRLLCGLPVGRPRGQLLVLIPGAGQRNIPPPRPRRFGGLAR